VLPLAIAMLLLPFSALFLRTTLFAQNSSAEVSCVMGVNFLIVAIVVLIVWMAWLFGVYSGGDDNHWFENRRRFSGYANCAHHEWNSGVYQVDGVHVCLAAFLLWASPLMLFGVCLFLGCFLLLLSRTVSNVSRSSTRFAIRFLSFVVGVTVVGMYSASSISGAGMELSNAAFAIYTVALVAVVVLSGATLGWSTLETKLKENGFVKRCQQIGSPGIDIIHGFAILAAPLYIMFLVLSYFNQLVRKCACGFIPSKPLSEEEKGMKLTIVATKLNRWISSWAWTPALFWTQILCLCLWMSRYGLVLTNNFFNRIITELAVFHWGVISVLFAGIGLAMFLIPVVPGPAVYLTCGILIVPNMESQLGGRSSASACNVSINGTYAQSSTDAVDQTPFWYACLWANFLSYSLKLIAHVLQQKLIGEASLGSSVRIRAIVQPNSRVMKAANYYLRQPGLTAAKVCIMCGGPDWPTSVICGFMKLPMKNLLLGLTPMFLMTVPTTLTGAFMNPPSPVYSNLLPLLFLVVIMVQAVMAVGIMYYVSRAPADVIAEIPDDKEVKELEEKEHHIRVLRKNITRYQELPTHIRYMLNGGTGVLLATFYALALIPSKLFQPFGLQECIDILGKAPWDAVPVLGMSHMGIAAILGLIIGCSCMYYFSKWADAQVRARQAGSRPSGPETELNPSEPLGGGGGYIPSKASSNKMISASV